MRIFTDSSDHALYNLSRLCETGRMPRACGLFILLDGTGGINQTFNSTRIEGFIESVRILYMSESINSCAWQEVRQSILRCDWNLQVFKPSSQTACWTEHAALRTLISLIDAVLAEEQNDLANWRYHTGMASSHACRYQQEMLDAVMRDSAPSTLATGSQCQLDELGDIRHRCFNAQQVCFEQVWTEVERGIECARIVEEKRIKALPFCRRWQLELRSLFCVG
jgi:hypothetical protein